MQEQNNIAPVVHMQCNVQQQVSDDTYQSSNNVHEQNNITYAAALICLQPGHAIMM
jgi:hypothetical protein